MQRSILWKRTEQPGYDFVRVSAPAIRSPNSAGDDRIIGTVSGAASNADFWKRPIDIVIGPSQEDGLTERLNPLESLFSFSRITGLALLLL